MTKYEETFSNWLKKIPAAPVSFIIGIVVALVVNYISGSDSHIEMFIQISGIAYAASAGILWRMRHNADRIYNQLFDDANTKSDAAWEKAVSPSAPGKANLFFSCLLVAGLSLLGFIILICIDNFILPSDRDTKEDLILEKLYSIQVTTRADSINGTGTLRIVSADSALISIIKANSDSILHCSCKKLVRSGNKKSTCRCYCIKKDSLR
jgi:hypothetical protein